MYLGFLKRSLSFYLASGLLAAALVFMNLYTYRTNTALGETVDRMRTVYQNKSRLRAATERLTQTVSEIDQHLPPGYEKTSPREFLFRGLDTLRNHKPGQTVVTQNLLSEGGRHSLPVSLKFPFISYADLVTRVSELEQMRFPFFRISAVTFEMTGEHAAVCEIRGELLTLATQTGGAP